MKKSKYFLLAVFVLVFVNNAITQSRNNPFILYSKKKLSYFMLKNGKEMQGYIKNYDSYKGFIENITFIDKNGKRHKIDAKDINRMYLFPSIAGKLIFACEYVKEPSLDPGDDNIIITQSNGYVLFESTEVYLKEREGKKKHFLLPLLNPSYSDKIKIFPDPEAYTVSSTKVIGITTKKVLSSYYVKKGDQPAYKITKWNFKNIYKELFKGHNELENMHKPKWSKFKEYVFQYTVNSKEL